ncbi:hypothetical protein BKA61DRAFT_686277 [Leptodontidium sp. MPI-SDFR-AT-0119]|nr:hypothetical protein BKA61DRAFT_686277 [Leptodontidium sp. MPI-SDFR-AT-0119]
MSPFHNADLDTSDFDHDVEMEDNPPPVPARGQSYISDISKRVSTTYSDQEGPRSPPRSPRLRHMYPSVPSGDLENLNEAASGKDPLGARAHNKLSKARGEASESKPKDSQEKLNTVLSDPHYQQISKELQDEVRRRQEYETMLNARDTQLSEVRSKAKSELEEKNKELEDINAANQGSHQLTDQYLVDRITLLRYSIRNFSIQYFEGELKHEPKIVRSKYFDTFVVPETKTWSGRHEVLTAILRSSSWCSSLIQATLWRVFCRMVFGEFRWAGSFAEDMLSLHRLLRPAPSLDNQPNHDAERKFQTWRANTSTLLLDRLDLKKGNETSKEIGDCRREIVHHFFEALEPYLRSKKDVRQALFDIVSEAITLDQELSRQVAKFSWVFESEESDPSDSRKKYFQLPVAPGLKKRGKSSGEDFKTEISLLPVEVSYVPVVMDGERGGRRG